MAFIISILIDSNLTFFNFYPFTIYNFINENQNIEGFLGWFIKLIRVSANGTGEI